jgi:two-component system, NtrC family, response regulator HydG
MADVLAIHDQTHFDQHRPHALDVSPEDFPPVDSAMQALYARAERAAAVNSTVLITGESGTGKEVLARRIHRLSARRHGPFVPVNCGGLPETLVETELFGYKRGAFTGAVADSKGLIEEARGGVLFLDEIGDTPLSIQVRLLRFLDSGEVRAVGGTSIKHVDVRVIAATNRPLLSDIREKRFREDLYFRLSVVSLHLPGLRERRADLADLVQYHVRRVSRKLGIPAPRMSDEAMTLLLRYDWPGNIRELQNALEQALIQDSDRLITPQDLPPSVQRGSMELVTSAMQGAEQDQATLASALRRHRGNRSEAAASLGISRTTLWRRLRQLNSNSA